MVPTNTDPDFRDHDVTYRYFVFGAKVVGGATAAILVLMAFFLL